jgi:hypothetical protein
MPANNSISPHAADGRPARLPTGDVIEQAFYPRLTDTGKRTR